MKSKIIIWSAVLCVLAVTPVLVIAGSYSKLNFIGFSRDGKYLAFEDYGTGDASGEPFATLYFVDTEKNVFIGKPFKVWIQNERATEEMALAKVERLGAQRMRELKIERGNTGRLLAAQLLSDETKEYISPLDDNYNRSRVRFTTRDNPELPGRFYELTLNLTEIKPATCDDDSGVYSFYKFELSLDNYDSDESDKNIPTTILQKDEKIPESRGCPNAYRMERVYVYKDKIAVFLNVYSRGFEGPDMNYMVVTGKMPKY